MEFAKKIRNTKLTNVLCSNLLVLASILVFYNSLQNELVYDDHFVVVQNEKIRTLDALDFLITEYWVGFKKEDMGTYYRPITILKFALDYALWELDPFDYHLTNLLIHATAAFLLFLLLIRIQAPISVALLYALLFAVHPVHTEPWQKFLADPIYCLRISPWSHSCSTQGRGKANFLAPYRHCFSLYSARKAL